MPLLPSPHVRNIHTEPGSPLLAHVWRWHVEAAHPAWDTAAVVQVTAYTAGAAVTAARDHLRDHVYGGIVNDASFDAAPLYQIS